MAKPGANLPQMQQQLQEGGRESVQRSSPDSPYCSASDSLHEKHMQDGVAIILVPCRLGVHCLVALSAESHSLVL